MHRYAKRSHAPNVQIDCYSFDPYFMQARKDANSQAKMLQNLARLQKSTDTAILPTFIGLPSHKMDLCGVIFKTTTGMFWYDFDVVTCKLLSKREIHSTDAKSIRREIHLGGFFAATNDFKVSIRSAR